MKSLPSGWKYSIGLIVSILLLFAANLWVGSVRIPAGAVWDILCGHAVERESWRFILLESRIPQGITALLCGAALAVSGLMLQTVFSNPLAGPSILGINTGASLGVALVMLLGGGSITAGVFSISGFLAVLAGAFAGAMIVMGILLFFSAFTKNNLMLLIIGIMIGYITSSVISLLNFFSTAEGVHSYMIWGLGNFSGVSSGQLPVFVVSITAGLVLSVMLIKPLNALLLGNRYAECAAYPQSVIDCDRYADGNNNRLLRAYRFYRIGRAAYCPLDAGYFEPQFPDACDLIAGRGGSPVV